MQRELVTTVKGTPVELYGFGQADEQAHMFEWLRQGRDFRRIVAEDIEVKLCAQDARSKLLSLQCTRQPAYDVRVGELNAEGKAILRGFTAVFPLVVRVRSGAGQIWRLEVELGYHGTDLDRGEEGEGRVQVRFEVLGQATE
ncbi:hypothetical protein ACX3YG_10120 [Pseudomonas wadenswilerensis]